MGIEVAAIVMGGQTELSSNNSGLAPMAQGLVLRDRNGMSSRIVFGLLIAVAGALAQSGPKSVESRSYQSGNYIVTETKTTYYSEAEKAQMRENTNKAIDGVFATKYSEMELTLFSRDRFGRGDSSGYKVNFYMGGGDSLVFEGGLGGGKIDSIVDNGGTPTTVRYRYLGMPFRVSRAMGPVRVAATYEWNWLKYSTEDVDRVVHLDMDGTSTVTAVSHPWHLDLSTVAFRRISLKGGLTAQQIRKPGEFGYYVQAGVMF